MKKIIFSIMVSLQAMMLLAQPWSIFDVQEGEIVHDFTEYDLVENLPYNLYSFLEDGKTVYLFFFDATDPECWTYHNSNILQNFSNDYGSNGQNSVKFLTSIVSGNSYADVVDISDETMGDWTINATFPILQILTNGHLKSFGGVYMYRICPDKRVYRSNYLTYSPLSDFPTYDELVAGIGQCEVASESIDAKIVFSNTDTVSTCEGEFRPANAYLSNMGFDALQSCDVIAEINGVVVDSVAWSGNLNTYQLDTITFDALPLSGVYSDVRFYAKNLNGTTDQNTANDTLYRPLQAPTFWNSDTVWVEINTDGAGYDLYWDIKNSAGATVASGGNPYVGQSNGTTHLGGTDPGPGPGYYQPNSEFFYTIPLSETPDCYTIRVLSSNGDGATGYFGDFVGFMRFKIGSNIIFDFDDFGRRGYGKFFTADIAPVVVSYAVVNTTNTQPNGSITVTASGGLPPYQYSNDCGANFGSSNQFSDLLAGTYCMVTKDAIGQIVTDTVEVENVNDVLLASYAVTHTTNGLPNGSITTTATGGVAPYQYSNDCGANFGSSNEFGSLAAGTYCMVTKDAIGQTVTDSVVVNSSLSSTDATRGLSGLSVRPNPAKEIISVGFVLQQSGSVGISVYNAIGQQVVSVPTRVYAAGHQSVPIDVVALPTGLYFVVVQDERGVSTTRFVKK